MSVSIGGGRVISAPWSRLKAVPLDALEDMGLPSKGDNRLLDHKTQETYYNKIVERYMAFCAASETGTELDKAFSSLTIANAESSSTPSVKDTPTPAVNTSRASDKELATLIMAMRKLREGIVASHRVDEFAVQVYIFCIRAAILTRHMESYHPALLQLLRRMHPQHPLSPPELQEFTGYLVLDLACRQQHLAEAYALRSVSKLRDRRVDAVLDALVHDNYHRFWQIKRSVDGYKAKIMEYAEPEMRMLALKCLGKSYFSVSRTFLVKVTATEWRQLKDNHQVGWELDGERVIIKKPKAG
ncbi:MAG: hypothetical protein M1817_003021 [Caeruleum heppii]|nr:MAG: hypothetical protein M1817_003021 [Caeruleum heppii]